ncbi:MAG: ferrochelatase, partial [bacterium]
MTAHDKSKPTGVLLYNLGAPETLDGIQPFLTNLFSDPIILPVRPAFLRRFVARKIAKSRAKKVAPGYSAIGGGSPLLEITKRQAAALEMKLAAQGLNVNVFVGMRYSTPNLLDAISNSNINKLARLVLLPLYPQYSITTTGSALAEIERIRHASKSFPETLSIEHWHDHPGYLDAMAVRLSEEMEKFSSRAQKNLHVIFSAHSIPEKFALRGDPYPEQVRRTVEGIVE